MKKTKLLLADDHLLILQSLTKLLNDQPHLEVIKTVSNGKQVVEALEEIDVDIAILDLNMPVMNGLESMEVITKKYPDLKVLILTIYQEEYVINKLVRLGVMGFLLKNTALDNMLVAIDRLNNGEKYLDDIKQFIKPKSNSDKEVSLSKRELEIIKLIASGHSSLEIGDKLFISEFTVQTHRKNILQKLGLNNTPQLVSFAKSSGIIH